jgi:hypothetical protein
MSAASTPSKASSSVAHLVVRHGSNEKITARRTGASGAQLTSVAAVTNSSRLDIGTETSAEQRGERNRRRRTYLPSAQVLSELVSLGPDLSMLAADLHERLSGPSEDRTDLAPRPA